MLALIAGPELAHLVAPEWGEPGKHRLERAKRDSTSPHATHSVSSRVKRQLLSPRNRGGRLNGTQILCMLQKHPVDDRTHLQT